MFFRLVRGNADRRHFSLQYYLTAIVLFYGKPAELSRQAARWSEMLDNFFKLCPKPVY